MRFFGGLGPITTQARVTTGDTNFRDRYEDLNGSIRFYLGTISNICGMRRSYLI